MIEAHSFGNTTESNGILTLEYVYKNAFALTCVGLQMAMIVMMFQQ